MIICMCNTIIQDDKTKEIILEKMEKINNIEIKKKETEEEIQTQ